MLALAPVDNEFPDGGGEVVGFGSDDVGVILSRVGVATWVLGLERFSWVYKRGKNKLEDVVLVEEPTAPCKASRRLLSTLLISRFVIIHGAAWAYH